MDHEEMFLTVFIRQSIYLLVVPKVSQYIDLNEKNVDMDMTRKESYFIGYKCIDLKTTLKIYLL